MGRLRAATTRACMPVCVMGSGESTPSVTRKWQKPGPEELAPQGQQGDLWPPLGLAGPLPTGPRGSPSQPGPQAGWSVCPQDAGPAAEGWALRPSRVQEGAEPVPEKPPNAFPPPLRRLGPPHCLLRGKGWLPVTRHSTRAGLLPLPAGPEQVLRWLFGRRPPPGLLPDGEKAGWQVVQRE